jgi:hypothetical protein
MNSLRGLTLSGDVSVGGSGFKFSVAVAAFKAAGRGRDELSPVGGIVITSKFLSRFYNSGTEIASCFNNHHNTGW